jgi:hypothetical protein
VKHIEFYESINKELVSLKDKVRNLIDNAHWLTDGELKESILRNLIRRHMPENIEVGRGFIITEEGCSKQIDILLIDKSFPVLFRDGDLVFVTPNAVRGIIEVKTTADSNNVVNALENLTFNSQFLSYKDCFVGLFAYESNLGSRSILEKLKFSADGTKSKVVNHVCIGADQFYKFWDQDPLNVDREINRWNHYSFRKELAPAFFINNLLNVCSDGRLNTNSSIWFRVDPLDSERTKETYLSGSIDLI